MNEYDILVDIGSNLEFIKEADHLEDVGMDRWIIVM
jgi:hypothetical protein